VLIADGAGDGGIRVVCRDCGLERIWYPSDDRRKHKHERVTNHEVAYEAADEIARPNRGVDLRADGGPERELRHALQAGEWSPADFERLVNAVVQAAGARGLSEAQIASTFDREADHLRERALRADGGQELDPAEATAVLEEMGELAERQTDAIERVADELRYQNAVLSEVVRTLDDVAGDDRTVRTASAVHTAIDDHRVTRDVEESDRR
jgi:hypothetical protein